MTTAEQPDTAPLEAPEWADEEVIFRPDGTVLLKLDGVRYRLKRPKFRELKETRQTLTDLGQAERDGRAETIEAMNALLEPVQAKLRALPPAEDGEVDPHLDERAALVEEAAAVRASEEFAALQAAREAAVEASDRAMLEWFRDAILRRLGSPAARGFDGDDVVNLPPWVVDATFIKDLLAHWSSVPRRPGAS